MRRSGNPPTNLGLEAIRIQQYDDQNPTWGTRPSIRELSQYICNNRLNPIIKETLLNEEFFTFHTFYELDINCFRAKEIELQENVGLIAPTRYHENDRPDNYDLRGDKKAITPAYKAFLRACQEVLPQDLVRKLRSFQSDQHLDFTYSEVEKVLEVE